MKTSRRDAEAGIAILEACLASSSDAARLWHAYDALLQQAVRHPEQQGQFEMRFLQLKSELARVLPVLERRLPNGTGFTDAAMAFLGGSGSLVSITSQSGVAVSKHRAEWHRMLMHINETIGTLTDIQKRVQAGERVPFGDRLLYIPKPFPWKRVLAATGGAFAVVLLVTGIYVGRVFFGIGAPDAGVGWEVDPALSNREQVAFLAMRLRETFEREDLDLFMSAFSDDVQDNTGRTKRTLRAFLATFLTALDAGDIDVDLERAEITLDGDTARVAPIRIETPVANVTIGVMGTKQDNRWLITYVESL